MKIVVTQVASSLLAANTPTNFYDKMKYKNVWLHLFSIHSQITVAVVYLLTCTWTIRCRSKRLPYVINEMFELRNLREIWRWNSWTRRWGFRFSWIRQFVARFVLTDVSKAVRSVETSGTTIPVTHRRIKEDPNPHVRSQIPKQKYYHVPRELIYKSLQFTLLELLQNILNSLNKDRPTWCHLLYYFTIYCSTCLEC
jgi:hypothetical protein